MRTMQVDRAGLSLAAAISLTLASAQLQAQETSKLEEVIVTGSFIRGTPEDSAMPVEVVSFEEIENMGRPSNLDLIKTMSESGGVAGENNRINFYPIGAVTVNLRSLGSRFTTVVFNGRRFPEQYSVNTGRFNNIAWIPNAAIGSVETLKAGGGATYGADAVAGVVNYVTRKGWEGLELNADYRYIENSDGDYNADVLWGADLGNAGSLLVSASYQHRSALKASDRDWINVHFLENPESYLSYTSSVYNPGSVVFQRAIPGLGIQSFTPGSATASQLHMSAGGTVRDVGCTELGGFAGWTNTPTPGCYFNAAETEELVSDQDTFSLYVEHNLEVSDSLRFHTELMAYRQELPEIALAGTFTNNPMAWPLIPGTVSAANPQGLPVQQNINGTNAYFVPGSHPAVANLLNDLRNPDGSFAFTDAQRAAIINTGRVGLQNFLWKPFGNGGTPRGDLDRQENYLTMYRISEAIGGDLPEFWGTNLEWELGLTYSYIKDEKKAEDILVTDMQAALNGFGGPNCTGTVAGAGGCQWFNPFSSAIERNVFSGGMNPYYEATLANSRELVDWLYQPIWFDREYKHYVVDPIVRGELGVELPGGPIAIAVGGQYRRQDERVTLDEISNRDNNPCTVVGVTDCFATAQVGPWLYDRPGMIFGAAASNHRPEARHYPVAAGFIETRLPLLESLDVSIAGRYEKFFSDVSDKDNDVFVPAVAIKWQPLDWFGTRLSWGETFSQVNPPRPRDPIFAASTGSTRYIGLGGTTAAGSAAYATYDYANLDIKPETGEYLDFGFLFNAGGFSANIDYYYITIDDYTRTMTTQNVLDAIAMEVPDTAVPASSVLVNCSSAALTQGIAAMDGRPLAELLGSCVQGTTTMEDMIGGRVNYFRGTGQTNSGKLKSSGIDLSMRYVFDAFGGTLTPSVDVSRVLKWELGDYVLGGVKVADGYDGLGYVNSGAGRTNQSVAKYRANAGLLFNIGRHTINIQSQYVPSIINDDQRLYSAANNKNANIGDANGFTANGAACTVPGPVSSDLGNVPAGAGSGQYGTGVGAPPPALSPRGFCASQNTATLAGQEVEDWLNVDLIYRVELPWDLVATAVVGNVLDTDPSFYRGVVPYNSAYGSPLGRTYKLGFTKRF